jgi:pyruvate/2-oxoglutarate dehydrogenase complex dihydrolipoamide acyltransferase (E2) component
LTEKHENGALEKLNRGIQDSKQMVQRQTMELAQDYFDDSAEVLRQQINESRATLEDMPDQIPGRDEAFQMLFQELMDNYASMEKCINEAQQNVASLDTERFRMQGEVDATDAARRQAREQDLDLTEIEGTGSEGRVVADDVKNLAQSEGNVDAEELSASDAARRKAQELGVDLSEAEGTGSEGNIVVDDVTSMAESSKEQATSGAGQAARGAQDAAGQATQQAQGAMGQVAGQLGDIAGQARDTAGSTVQQTQDVAQRAQNEADEAARQAEQSTTGDKPEEPKVTSAARRKAEEMGVDPTKVEGTGSGGLVTLKDVMGS